MAQQRIETSIDIDASPAHVWAVLTDFPTMPDWNPFIRALTGEAKAVARLSVHIAPPGSSGMRFRPVVLVAEPARELRWRGRFLVPGLFDGEHYFRIEPRGTGVRFVHGEAFSGLLVGLMRGALAATETGFNAMNAALKRRAEGAATDRG